MLFGNPVEGDILPLGAPPSQQPGRTPFRVTNDFGPTTNTREPRRIWPGGEGIPAGDYPHFHPAIDLGNRGCGAKVLAAAAGRVTFAGALVYTEDGITYRPIVVKIDHGGGYETEYWHLADETVHVGQMVAKGQLIGHVGATGNTNACHLHFRMELNGEPVDPWRRLEQNQEENPVLPIDGGSSPQLVDWVPNAQLYDLNAKPLTKTDNTVTGRPSPYGVVVSGATYRVIETGHGGGQLALVKPGSTGITLRPVPVPPAPTILKPGIYKV